jgi:hypothetical protein
MGFCLQAFCCKGRIDEYEKDDKELMIQKAKENKEKCRKEVNLHLCLIWLGFLCRIVQCEPSNTFKFRLFCMVFMFGSK